MDAVGEDALGLGRLVPHGAGHQLALARVLAGQVFLHRRGNAADALRNFEGVVRDGGGHQRASLNCRIGSSCNAAGVLFRAVSLMPSRICTGLPALRMASSRMASTCARSSKRPRSASSTVVEAASAPRMWSPKHQNRKEAPSAPMCFQGGAGSNASYH